MAKVVYPDKPTTMHIDYAKQHVPEVGPDVCPKCSGELEQGYGMAGGGMGVYTYCPRCGDILSKTQTD